MKKNKKKRKNNLLKTFKEKLKGFTLVELLAVIVILAIIMIIAIPSVLNTMESAKQKTTIEMIQKIHNLTIKKVMEDEMMGLYNNLNTAPSNVVWNYTNTETGDSIVSDLKFSRAIYYDIRHDLDVDSLGNFFGQVIVYFYQNSYYYYYDIFDEERNYYWWSINNSVPENYSDFCLNSSGKCKGTDALYSYYANSKTNTGPMFLAEHEYTDNYSEWYYNNHTTTDGKYMKDFDYIYLRSDLD